MSHAARKPVDKGQIKKVHTLKSKLGMTDDEYRLLLSDYWVNTSKGLSHDEADSLIRRLEQEALAKGVWSRRRSRGKMRYEDLGSRPGMASPRQLRMIEAMWKEVSYTHDAAKRQHALRKFVFRITGVQDLRFLDSEQTRKVIKSLQSMRRK